MNDYNMCSISRFFSTSGKVPDIVITTCWILSLMLVHFITVVERPFLFGVINVTAISQ
jgi:hypothetical protein